MKIVIDTNVFISAVFFGGLPLKVLQTVSDLLTILSHIVAILRMELLLTQMFTPLKAPR